MTTNADAAAAAAAAAMCSSHRWRHRRSPSARGLCINSSLLLYSKHPNTAEWIFFSLTASTKVPGRHARIRADGRRAEHADHNTVSRDSLIRRTRATDDVFHPSEPNGDTADHARPVARSSVDSRKRHGHCPRPGHPPARCCTSFGKSVAVDPTVPRPTVHTREPAPNDPSTVIASAASHEL